MQLGPRQVDVSSKHAWLKILCHTLSDAESKPYNCVDQIMLQKLAREVLFRSTGILECICSVILMSICLSMHVSVSSLSVCQQFVCLSLCRSASLSVSRAVWLSHCVGIMLFLFQPLSLCFPCHCSIHAKPSSKQGLISGCCLVSSYK